MYGDSQVFKEISSHVKQFYPDALLKVQNREEIIFSMGSFRTWASIKGLPAEKLGDAQHIIELILNRIKRELLHNLGYALMPGTTWGNKEYRSQLFGSSKDWRSQMLGEKVRTFFHVTEQWTPDGKQAIVTYRPRHNPEDGDPVVKYIKKTVKDIIILKEPTFELKKLLDPNFAPEKAKLEIRQDTVHGDINQVTRFTDDVFRVAVTDEHAVIVHKVVESTKNSLIVDVFAVAQKDTNSTEGDVDKLSKRYTIRTSDKGKNTQSVSELNSPAWMAQAVTKRDFVKNPNNRLMHEHIKEDEKFAGEYVWVCSNDLVYVRGFADTWWPLDGGLKALAVLSTTVGDANYKREYDEFLLVERLKK